jgi:hypothetical protein
LEQVRPKKARHLTRVLIAVVAMFLQQTCGSVGRVLPAVLAPLIILELHADPSWVGVYFGLTAVAALIGQLGSGWFIIRHGAIRMSQIALLSTGGGMAVARCHEFRAVGAYRQQHRGGRHSRQFPVAWQMRGQAIRTVRTRRGQVYGGQPASRVIECTSRQSRSDCPFHSADMLLGNPRNQWLIEGEGT